MTSKLVASQQFEVLRTLIEPTAVRLREAGHQLFFVGGIVRDLLLAADGEGPADFSDVDLTTDARPKAIKHAVASSADSIWTQGERFGTIGAMIGDHAFEITTHRAEAYDPTSRKPVVSFGDDLETDLSRRDFTVNAMAIDVSAGTLADPFGGRADLWAHRLRTPLDPEISFTDDPLRMLRAARFIPRFGLAPSPDVLAAAIALADRLTIVSGERIHDELEKMLGLPSPATGLRFLLDAGLLNQLGLASASDALDRIAVLPTARARRAGLLLAMSDDDALAFLELLRYSNADRRSTMRLLAGARSLVEEWRPDRSKPLLRFIATTTGAEAMDDVISVASLAGLSDADQAASTEVLAELRRTEDLDDRSSPLEGEEIMELLQLASGPAVGDAVRFLEGLRVERGPLTPEEARSELLGWAELS
jgi:poly(A) polymerase